MKIKLKDNTKIFQDLLGIMNKVTNEVKLTFNSEGLVLFGMSGGTTAVKQQFGTDFFEEYVVGEEQEEYGVMLNDLVKPLKKMKDEFTLENVENRLVLTGGKDKYTLPIIEDVSSGPGELPTIEYTYNATTTFAVLAEALDKLSIVGADMMWFFTEDGKLKVRSKSNTREFVTEICDSEEELVGEPLFSIKLITELLTKSTDNIKLNLLNENPLTLVYENNGAVMTALVAPRIDN